MPEPNWVDKKASNNEWWTPGRVNDRTRVYCRGPIPLDPATDPSNPTRALRFYTGKDDGLVLPWDAPVVFVNPPYSMVHYSQKSKNEAEAEVRKAEAQRILIALKDKGEVLFGLRRADVSSLIVLWAAKIHLEARRGVPILALLPCGARFSTAYWQDHILIPELRSVCFVRGRLKFINGETGEIGTGQNNYDSMVYGFNTDAEQFVVAYGPLGTCSDMRIRESRCSTPRRRPHVMDGFH